MTDIDRAWVEVDTTNGNPSFAIIDLKWAGGIDKSTTSASAQFYEFQESVGVPVYIVKVSLKDPHRFIVNRFKKKVEREYNELEYAEWLLERRGKECRACIWASPQKMSGESIWCSPKRTQFSCSHTCDGWKEGPTV